MGIVFAYWLNTRVVFRVPLSWKGMLVYPLVYVIQYGVSAIALGILVERQSVSQALAPLVVTVAMLPVTYIMSKLIINWARIPEMDDGMLTVNYDDSHKMRQKEFSSPLPLWVSLRSDCKWWLPGALLSFLLANIVLLGLPYGLIPVLSHPFVYAGDGLSHFWLIQRAIEGWIFDNPRSGYPFGSTFLDYPGSDSGSLLILKLLGKLTGTFYGAANLYFLLAFPGALIASFLVMRAFSIRPAYSLAGALLFAFAPFGFSRLFYGHIFFTWYFVIPLYYYYGLKIFFEKNISWPFRNPKAIALLLVSMIALSSFGVYFAFFGVLVFTICGIAAFIKEGRPRALLISALLSSMIAIGVGINVYPNVVHYMKVGENKEVAHRSPIETEVYGLKIMHLLLPQPEHRFKSLRTYAQSYNNNFPLSNTTSSLGIFGIAGFLIIIFFTFSSAVGNHSVNIKLGVISVLVLSLLLISTVGGFNVLFSTLVTPTIRGWDRISIFIFFGSIFAFFIALQENKRLEKFRQTSKAASILIPTFIAVIGLLDQTPGSYRARVEAAKRNFLIDSEFIHSIEASVPQGSAIYQLPYVGFPEKGQVGNLGAYSLLSGFINSKSLRWSSGGMMGREGDIFYRSLSGESVDKQLKVVRRLGFAGIYIDRQGFSDHGNGLIDRLIALLGKPPALIRSDGEVVFFRIDPDPGVDLNGLSAPQIMRRSGYIPYGPDTRYEAVLADGIDFTRKNLPSFIKDVKGLSFPGIGGRWSDANLAPLVRIDFFNPLPNCFTLVMSAMPFGPNSGKTLRIHIGSQMYQLQIQAKAFEGRIPVDLKGEKVFSIEFQPPQPTSPKELGLGLDNRKLGIGFIRLRFESNN